MSLKRAERLFHLVSILRTGRGYTGGELANALGVSQRTIYRDVVDLSTLVSIYYDEGYRLLSESFLANLTFTHEELLALKLGIQLQPLAEGSHFGGATLSALAKIDEQLNRRFRNAEGENEIITVHVKAYPLTKETVRALRVLESAIRARQTVELTYYSLSRGEINKRTVDPYNLTFRRHSWYLIGYCHLRRNVRIFRLDRIHSAKLILRKFEKPPGFSVEEFFADTWEVFAPTPKEEVVLRFDSGAEPIAKPVLEARGKFRQDRPRKGLIFEGRVPLTDEFCRWLLTLGRAVEVLEPRELREKVAAKHQEAAALYTPARDKPLG